MFLRKYEMVLLTNPADGADGVERALGRVRDAFKSTGAREVRLEDWGVRRLAYEMEGQLRAHYLYLLFLGSNETVAEAERLLRITDTVMKFQTILLEDRVAVEGFDFEAAAGELTQLAKRAKGKVAIQQEAQE